MKKYEHESKLEARLNSFTCTAYNAKTNLQPMKLWIHDKKMIVSVHSKTTHTVH